MSTKPKHVVMGPEISDGVRLAISHNESGEIEPCILTKPSRDGGTTSEKIRLEPCPDERASPGTYHMYPADHKSHDGPAWVSNPKYCKGWEETFGKTVN